MKMPRYSEGLGTALPDAIREIIGHYVARRYGAPTKLIMKGVDRTAVVEGALDQMFQPVLKRDIHRWEDDGGR